MNIILNKNQLAQACEPFEFIDDKGKDQTVVDEMTSTAQKLKDILTASDALVAISAPQIGLKKRMFCIKFNDVIKTFINPVIKKRSEEKFINQETYIDGKSRVYICRPKEIEVTYFTDEFRVEDNKLLDQAAAIFMQQYNLLDGITPGALLDSIDEITEDNLATYVDATYSGSGLVMSESDEIPELHSVAEILSKISALAEARLQELAKSNNMLAKTAKRFLFDERVILGRTKVVDSEGWEREKQYQRQVARINKHVKANQFKQLAAKACK